MEASGLGVAVVAAESDPRGRERLRSTHGAIEIVDDPDAVLERHDLDAVFVYSDNRASADLAARALERRIPTMVEKPMAADLAGAQRMVTEAEASGTPLMVNWPIAWRPAVRDALGRIQHGEIGEPIQLSHRGSQIGPREYGCSDQFCEWLYDPHRNGGGVLIDYCCYGAVICSHLLGLPSSVSATAAHLRKPDLPSEDNAIVTLRYPRALALLEASWTQIGLEPAFAFIVYGDRGTMLVHQPKPAREGAAATIGRVQVVTIDGNETFDPPAPAPDELDGPSYFLSRLRDGRPIQGMVSAATGLQSQRILDAAQRSVRLGRVIEL
jgi:predicted dehydrogenase